MRVILDTNIYISALVLPGGQAEKAVHAAVEGGYELLISKPIIHEVLEVLARKFARDAEELARVALFLADLGETVQPRRRVRLLRDDPARGTARAPESVGPLIVGHYRCKDPRCLDAERSQSAPFLRSAPHPLRVGSCPRTLSRYTVPSQGAAGVVLR